MKEHFVNWGPPPLVRLPIHCMLARALTNGMGRRSNDALVPAASESSQKRSPRRSAVVVTASSVAPRAPLPSEAAAESSGHAVPIVWQALQAWHTGLEASTGLSHSPTLQHASHETPPEAATGPPEAHAAPEAATQMVTCVIAMSA